MTKIKFEFSRVEELERYILTNFNLSSRLAAIMYIRQWAEDNRNYLSKKKYKDLCSIAGARNLVWSLIY